MTTDGQHNTAVDLLIPARDEQGNIPALFDALPLTSFRQVVVVDNASTDQTASMAAERGAVVVTEAQPGYGAACLAGLAWLATQDPPPDIVCFFDADLADDPDALERLWAPIAQGRADLVIASRPRLAEPGALTPPQRFGNALACGLIWLCTGKKYTDLGPMRAIGWDSLQSLDMRDRTWGWTVEMQYKAAARGLRTLEIDTAYRPRHAGKSKISGSIVTSIKAGWKILSTIAQLRFARG